MSNQYPGNPSNQTDEDVNLDDFDMPNPDAKNGAGGYPSIVYISANSEPHYDGTSVQGGGFMIVERNGISAPPSWTEEITFDDGATAKLKKSIRCAIIVASEQTRRYSVTVVDEGKEKAISHVDFNTKWWREEGQPSGQYLDAKGKAPKSRISIFIVLDDNPGQIYELGLKGGNANVVRNLNDQLNSLAAFQTKRLKTLGEYGGNNNLMGFVNWVELTAGTKLEYSQREGQTGDAGGFSRISIQWPSVPNLKQFQRQFVQKDNFGEKVQHWLEWNAVKARFNDETLAAMYVGKGNYARFYKMRQELDGILMDGYIKPLASFEAIEEAIDRAKARYFERSIAINSNQLPAQGGSHADDDGLPSSADGWDDAKERIAQGAPPPMPKAQPSQPTAQARPAQASQPTLQSQPAQPTQQPAPWSIDTLRKRLNGTAPGTPIQWNEAQVAAGWRDVKAQAQLRGIMLDGSASLDSIHEGLWMILGHDAKWPRTELQATANKIKDEAKKKTLTPDRLAQTYSLALEQYRMRFGSKSTPTGVSNDARGVVAMLMLCDSQDEMNEPAAEATAEVASDIPY